jgi:hypothetical protein
MKNYATYQKFRLGIFRDSPGDAELAFEEKALPQLVELAKYLTTTINSEHNPSGIFSQLLLNNCFFGRQYGQDYSAAFIPVTRLPAGELHMTGGGDTAANAHNRNCNYYAQHCA